MTGNERDKKASLPFVQTNSGDGWVIRRFASDVSPSALQWHRDGEDREVKVVQSDGWMLQKDNEIPVLLEKEKRHSILKGEWHRIIRGTGDLVLQIKKL